MDGFYLPPGPNFEPGDLFSDLPFPALRHPLEYFRPNTKNPKIAEIFNRNICPPKAGDTARGAFTPRTLMLLSHGCELDGVKRDVVAKKTSSDKRYWLAAPVLPLSECTSENMRQRTREARQPNKFYLPADDNFLGNAEHFVDLRKITPITVPYFLEAVENTKDQGGRKIASLTEDARLALQAHLGLFFAGLVLYVQPVACPHCSGPVDPKNFVVPSTDEEEQD
jgi:hypothetical protein